MEADSGEAAVGTPSLTLVLAPSPPPSPPVTANADAPDAVGVKTETSALLEKEDDSDLVDNGALDTSGAVNIYSWRACGYLGQYFAGALSTVGSRRRIALFIVLNDALLVASAASVLSSMRGCSNIFRAAVGHETDQWVSAAAT